MSTNRRDMDELFEQQRPYLRGVAYRMLGSATDAEDAVQEAWLRLHRSDASGIENLRAWLRTVVSRVCLDMLRSRKVRREDPMDADAPEPPAPRAIDPEQDALMADAVGLALLVVLETLAPAERLAFVLHDLFGVPFEEIGAIMGRSPGAARQLASRARRRVRGAEPDPRGERDDRRETMKAFLAALQAGDVAAVIALLDPDLVVHADAASAGGEAKEIRGAANWASQAVVFARAAKAFEGPARSVEAAMVDGLPGLILAPGGHLRRALRFTFAGARIAAIDVIGDPDRLRALEIAVLDLDEIRPA